MEIYRPLSIAVDNFENRFGIKFDKKELLAVAFNNASKTRVRDRSVHEYNPRLTRKTLSALGDTVLNLLSIEAELNRRSSIRYQSNSYLANRFDILDFQQYLPTMCRSDETKGNAIEAVLGAIYLDQGLETARDFCTNGIIAT